MNHFDKSCYEAQVPSTLCPGCGHDQISKAIIKASFEEQIPPHQLVKISGIGCSSKTPNYFLKMAQGFNTLHGRMASIATGVQIANSDLKVIGVSGDGDTGSIGLGSFLHTIKKDIPMLYLVENNGVYGLTKGQYSATAKNDTPHMDLCRLALETGCQFVARCFSGDQKELVSILRLALQYEGFAFIDVISPCVAYGNKEDFEYSFAYMKKNKITLDKIDEKHDSSNLDQASSLLRKYNDQKTIPTGLIYYQKKNKKDSKKSLISYDLETSLPSEVEFQKIIASFK